MAASSSPPRKNVADRLALVVVSLAALLVVLVAAAHGITTRIAAREQAAALAAEGLAYVPPEGSFYCLLPLPERWTRDPMAAALQLMDRHNVVTIPSSVFGTDGFLRLSFVAAPELLREGLRRIAAFFRES